MARYTGPTTKIKRKFGMLPESPARGRFIRRLSDYGLRLREKQKLKFTYGVLEKQFRRYFKKASADPQNTGLVLLQLLESRLDNLVYRLGFAMTRAQGRQLISHGHIAVDGKKVDVPSYNVKVGEIIEPNQAAQKFDFVARSLKETKTENLPSWLERKGFSGRVKGLPKRDEIPYDIDENLIIEYYSR